MPAAQDKERYVCIVYLYFISNPKQQSCKKECSPQKAMVKEISEIQGGGQEMAVMIG